jgi:hypothetical protein
MLEGQDKFNTNYSDIVEKNKFKDHQYPYPICVSIVSKENKTEKEYFRFFESAPFFSGIPETKCYVDTSKLGSKFDNTHVLSYYSNQSEIFLMGLFAAYLGGSIDSNLQYIDNPTLQVIFRRLIYLLKIDSKRIAPGIIKNYLYKMNDTLKEHTVDDADIELANSDSLIFIDGGIECNLAVAPFLRDCREVDVMIILDCADDLTGAPQLKKAEEYAKSIKKPFPKINYENIDKNVYSIFKEENKPTVIYIQLRNNGGYKPTNSSKEFPNYSTYKLEYSKEETLDLYNLMDFNLNIAKNDIIDEISNYLN